MRSKRTRRDLPTREGGWGLEETMLRAKKRGLRLKEEGRKSRLGLLLLAGGDKAHALISIQGRRPRLQGLAHSSSAQPPSFEGVPVHKVLLLFFFPLITASVLSLPFCQLVAFGHQAQPSPASLASWSPSGYQAQPPA